MKGMAGLKEAALQAEQLRAMPYVHYICMCLKLILTKFCKTDEWLTERMNELTKHSIILSFIWNLRIFSPDLDAQIRAALLEHNYGAPVVWDAFE